MIVKHCPLVLAVSALAFGACQKTKTQTKEVVREVVRPEAPWYQQSNVFQKTVYGEAIKLSRGSSCLVTDAQLLDSSNLLGIYSGASSETIIDRTYDFDDAGLNITPSKTNEQKVYKEDLDELFVCNPKAGSTNLEGVASYAASDIKVASDWYQTVTGETLPRLQLHVHPLETMTVYERLSDQAKARILKKDPKANVGPFKTQADAVDNAYWTLISDDSTDDPTPTLPIIAVYPHSSQASEDSANHLVALWELPFVLRHEYGHHVFYKTLTPLLGSAQVHLQETLAKNPTHLSTRVIVKPSVFTQDKGKSPLIDTAFLFGALNEGFADMYSFYASGLKMQGIAQAPCFVKTRDVASLDVGGLDVKKVFNSDLIDVLFNPKSTVRSFVVRDDAPCNTFNVLEIHDLGAVFAYTADKIFDAAPDVQNLTDATAKAKAKTTLALAWLSSLNQNLDLENDGPAMVLSKILESAAVTANGTAALTTGSPLCQAVKSNFPGFQTRWASKPLGVCFKTL